jgi:hypothetical protein
MVEFIEKGKEERVFEILEPIMKIYNDRDDYFFNLIVERAVKNRLPFQCFEQAVNHVIDTKQGNTLYVSDVIGYALELKSKLVYEPSQD